MYIETCVYTTFTCRIPHIAAAPEFDGGGGGIGITRPFSEKPHAGKRAAEQIIIIIAVVIIIIYFVYGELTRCPEFSNWKYKRRRVLNIRSCTYIYICIILYRVILIHV